VDATPSRLTASLFSTNTFRKGSVIFLHCHKSGCGRSIRLAFWGAAFLVSCAAFPQTKPAATQSFKQLSEQAAKASEENRLDEAAVLYRKALALQPRWAEGWWQIGTLQYDKNQYAPAARAFEKLVALRPTNGSAHAMLGLCQIELKQDAAALQHLSKAEELGVLEEGQLRRVVLYQLGSVQLRSRRFADAKTSFSQLVKDGVRSDELTTGMGMAALGILPANLPDQNAPGRNVVDSVGRAESLAAKKDFAGAKQIYALLVTEYPAYPNLHYAFGRFHLAAHELDDAVAAFQKELENDPKHLGALLDLAAVRYRVDSADGIQYAERAVKVSPQLPFAHYLLGLLYLDTDRTAEALPELEMARKAFAKQAQVYFALGNAYAKLGRKEDAVRMRAEFVRLNALEKAQKQGSDAGNSGDQSSQVVTEKLQQQSSPPKP
jgi:tetratricopeptide (TPR) repeat protein